MINLTLDIPLDFELNINQQLQVESYIQEKPLVDKTSINKKLSQLKFPLHFIDYETYASAIPKIEGMSPHKHLTFQASIHTLSENGDLTHFEYLLDAMEMPNTMFAEMESFTGSSGTFISWHASFEVGRNKDIINWLPQHTNYLTYMNEHMFDLEVFFKKEYVDYRFHGSSSIKKVLPVLCPQFSYQNLEVQDGTMALDTWGRMILDDNFNEGIEQTRNNLLEYCKLDTLAMVEIYKHLIFY